MYLQRVLRLLCLLTALYSFMMRDISVYKNVTSNVTIKLLGGNLSMDCSFLREVCGVLNI